MKPTFDLVSDMASALGQQPTLMFRIRLYLRALSCFIFERLAWWSPAAGLRSVFYRRMGMEIGEGVFLGSEILFDKSFPERIHIGDHTAIGDRCLIFAHANIPSLNELRPAYPMTVKDTVIESHVWIMPSCTIAPGVRIGHHSVIATGAVVYRDIPPNSFVTGPQFRCTPMHRSPQGASI